VPFSSTGATMTSANGARQDGSGHTAVSAATGTGSDRMSHFSTSARQARSCRANHSWVCIRPCVASWSRTAFGTVFSGRPPTRRLVTFPPTSATS
jgi:hypothetical protein